MAETTAAPTSPGATPKKTTSKAAASKVKKPRQAPSHPKVADMVTSAISTLKERGGSSLQAIKKYIASTYKVDVERLSPFIKKYLKTAVENGTLVQTKGKGAAGSFKLSASAIKKSQDKPKKVKKEASKKPKKPKKTVEKKAKKAAKPKTPKPKVKTPTKKPKASAKASTKAAKSPKPKKAAKPATKKSSPKKTAKK